MKDCREELLGRVRRGQAWGQDRAAFEAHLDSCESCRMTLDLMGDFDSVGEAEPGDSELIARMAATAAGTLGVSSPAPFRVPRRSWRFAVAALVITGSAVAGGLGWVALRSSTAPVNSPAENASARPSPAPVLAPSPTPTTAIPEPVVVVADAETPSTKISRRSATSSENLLTPKSCRSRTNGICRIS